MCGPKINKTTKPPPKKHKERKRKKEERPSENVLHTSSARELNFSSHINPAYGYLELFNSHLPKLGSQLDALQYGWPCGRVNKRPHPHHKCSQKCSLWAPPSLYHFCPRNSETLGLRKNSGKWHRKVAGEILQGQEHVLCMLEVWIRSPKAACSSEYHQE